MLEVGSIVTFLTAADHTPLPCRLVVEDAGEHDALMFRVDGTSDEYLWMTTDGDAGCDNNPKGHFKVYRAFIPEYHSTGDSGEQHNLEVVVSLRGLGAAINPNARQPTMGAYLGMKGGTLSGMLGLGSESTWRVKKVGDTGDQPSHYVDTLPVDIGDLNASRIKEPKEASKHVEFGSFAAKGPGKKGMGKGM